MSLGVRGIRVAFGDTVALDDVTLDVPSGAVTAVVGGDGAGKSTLLRVLAGRVGVDAGDVRTVAESELGYQPSTSGVWAGLTVDENIAFVGHAYRVPPDILRRRADELLARAGLAGARGKLGRELSGGMRQKLGLVLAILHAPRLVLLDEPSTGVDPVSRVELWRMIAETAADGAAVLLATTYLDEAARAASVVALDRAGVLGAGTPEEITASVPAAADVEAALIALTRSRLREEPPPEAGERPARATKRPVVGGPVAEGRDTVRRFGDQVAVDHVSIEVAAGEVVGIIGANGAGKTTFLRTLIGLDRPDGGEALLFGSAPNAASRHRIGYVPQGLGLSQNLSVAENAAFFARVYGLGEIALPPDLADVRHRRVGDIGLGRQRRLAFALALAHAPELLVLDEPTSGVDPLSRAHLWSTIHAQAEAGVGVVVTTHDLDEARQCTRLALMSRGRLVGTGSVDELTAGLSAVVVETPEWQRAFATLGAAGLPTMLAGRDIRVAGVAAADVRTALGDIPASVRDASPTLEEAMVLRES